MEKIKLPIDRSAGIMTGEQLKYDFTTIIDRSGWDAMAVDVKNADFATFPEVKPGFDIIPMWVADMNFPTVPTIPKALAERAVHPFYGYYAPRDEYYDAIIRWHKIRNGVTDMTKEDIGYENGVLGGVVSAMEVIGERGGKVLLHSPTYIGFTHCLSDNGYDIVLSPLKKDNAGVWRMDFEDMENKIRDNHIHAAVFCSPHNPSGRVWEKWELEKMMSLFKKYDVTVISDEIWSDLLLDDHVHIPLQSISEDAKMRTIALYAPSKTFNLAGLIGSYHVIYNPTLRDRIRRTERNTCYNNMNVLSMHAAMSAYSKEGAEWVDELTTVLSANVDFAVRRFAQLAPEIHISKPEGTYMLFLDCTDWCEKYGVSIDELQKSGQEVGVFWQDGRPFHGPCHIRMNLALPTSRVEEAFERLEKHVFNKNILQAEEK